MSIYKMRKLSLHRLKFLGDKTFNFCNWYSRNRKIKFCHFQSLVIITIVAYTFCKINDQIESLVIIFSIVIFCHDSIFKIFSCII